MTESDVIFSLFILFMLPHAFL